MPLRISHLSLSISCQRVGTDTGLCDVLVKTILGRLDTVDLGGVRRLRAEEDAHRAAPKLLDLAGISQVRTSSNQACILVPLAVCALETRR